MMMIQHLKRCLGTHCLGLALALGLPWGSAEAAAEPAQTKLGPETRLAASHLPGSPLPRRLLRMPQQATTWLQISGELDRRLSAFDPWVPFDPLDAQTYNKATSTVVWPTQGPSTTLAVYFRRMAGLDSEDSGFQTWWVQVTHQGQVAQAWLALHFGPDGRQADGANTVLHLPAGDAGLPQAIDLELSGFILESRGFGITEMRQDGHAAGRLQWAAVGADGRLVLHYSNGETRQFKRPPGP